ncbi:sigma-70 family RNA polymerase sigma factor [Symmachiella dynata]|uniref:RNA polymerase sigma factor n=1 Tax=Symmachiella dynata TaxID=2527995 RepID=UPI0030ECCFF8
MSNSDAEIVERVKQGDTDALGEFIELRRMQLLAFINRNVSSALASKVEPNDLLQEVTIHALRGLPDMEFKDRDPFNWLCQIAERRIIDAHRKYIGAQKRSANKEISGNSPVGGTSSTTGQGGLIDMLVVTMTTPSQAFSRDQREFKLQEVLATLPAESQEALRLRYVEGLPTKEIAQKIGKTDGSVRVLLSRSLNKLQDLLGPDANPMGR